MQNALQIAASLALATSRTSATRGATVRNVYAGVANRNGMLACDLAESGFTGEQEAIAITFGSVLGEAFDRHAIPRGLGTHWAITRNFIKLAASCRETQGALEAFEIALASASDRRLSADAIAEVRVETFASAAALDHKDPCSPLAARFSIPFTLATRIVSGATGVDSFGSCAIADPRTHALARKVTVVERPEFTARLPQERIAEVQVRLMDGTVIAGRVRGNRGDFDRPVPKAEHEHKFLSLGEPTWGARTLALRQACLQVDALADVRDFTALLTPHGL